MPELIQHRTLFVAKEPSYNEMITALKNNWVVGVRHDSVSGYKTRMLGGTNAAREFIVSKQNTWQWWEEGSRKMDYMWGTITVVGPDDPFEVAKPEKGVNIRVRCWWASVRQALKTPLVSLEQLVVDNQVIDPELIKQGGRRGSDGYYLYSIPDPAPESHVIKAKLKNLKTNQVRTIEKQFTYPAR